MIGPNEDLEPEGAESATREAASRLGEQSRKVLQDVRELGGMAAESVGAAATRLRSQGGEVLEEGKERLHKVQSELERYITAHPTKSVLLALGAGALIGLVLFRRPD
jgi:ElaB/YqjD/DUF883 family membrane-anchored ribosome-binding protein